ncbi:cytochrome P450 3A29-like [Physella acuta]|uniref:cytochrome P450 3A29-like n=1 Tax=Physella acuta TaxID=109671 RepID=UPI0027DE85B1|nr:cytochrome P450 3A29-like [Physella acuta]
METPVIDGLTSPSSVIDLAMPAVLLTVISCVLMLYRYGTDTHCVWTKLGVAGPKPAPFFGNILEMFDPQLGFRRCVKNWQGVYGRMFGIYFYRKPVLVVTDPEALKQIFVKDFSVFADRFFVGEGKLQHEMVQKTVFFARGSKWRRLRKMMTPSFSSGKLKLMTHCINRTANLLGDRLQSYAAKGESLEAKVVFGAYALDAIAGTTFGLDLDSQNNLNAPFIKHARSLMTIDKIIQLKLTLVGIFPAIIPLLKMFNIGYFKYSDIKYFKENIGALVAERSTKIKSQSDFLQLLLESEYDNKSADDDGMYEKKLTKDEVASQGLIFMIAGYDPLSSAMQYLFYQLAKCPDIQNKVYSEIADVMGDAEEPSYDNCQQMKYLQATIDETLRMYPPLHILTRQTTKDTTLGGLFIPANTGILIPVYNLARDPEFFPEPDVFRPERFLDASVNPVTFVPFGFGPRQCIGMRLALMELKIALVHVLGRLQVVKATPEVLEIEDFSGNLVPKTPIRIFLQVREK